MKVYLTSFISFIFILLISDSILGQSVSLSPNSGSQGNSFAVTVTGTGTTWSSDHCVELFDGVSTFSFVGTASSASSLSGTLNIPNDANASSNYAVTVYDDAFGACSGGSDGSCTNCFTVNAAPSISLSPNTGEQNSTFGVTVTGTGTSWSSMHCVELSDGVSTFTFTGTAANASTLTGTLSIPANANISANYDVKVYDDNFGTCSGDNDGLCVDCFSVTMAIPVVSISPNSGNQGDSFGVTVSGTNTTWASGTTHCVELTDGVSTFSFTGTANASQQLTGTINIPPAANASANYDITVYDDDTGLCSGGSDGTCTDCFTVNTAPSISISPNTGEQNTTFGVTVTGTGTSWSSMHCVELSDGVSTFTFIGTAANASSLSGTLSIPPGANVSSNYDVKVYSDNSGTCSGINDGYCVDCFTVTAPIPVVSISPNSGNQGDSFGVTVSGTNTTWASGTTHCVELTDGVSTFSFTGTANASQQLTGTINIPPAANASANYDITVYDDDTGLCSGGSDGTCTDCFTVNMAPSISISPNTGEQNTTFGVTVTGTGTSWSSMHCVELSDGVSTFTFIGTAANASSLSGTLSIPPGANVSSNYDVKVYSDNSGTCSGINDGYCVDCFTVTAPIPVVSISPNSGNQGDSFGVTVSGTNTTWASGTTHCVELTDGVSTFSFTGTANASQQLTGTINIPPAANASANYDITVYDDDTGLCSGGSDGTCTDCFTVNTAPSISISPNTGEQNTTFGVTVTGTGTSWSSMHCVELSDGVSTFTFIGTAANASSLSGTLSIPPGANVSSNYDVKVYSDNSGTCSGINDGYCVDCFTVTAPVPVVSISPNSGMQGESFSVTVTGTNTSWASNTPHCVELFDGVSTFSFVGTANASQQLAGTIDIPNGANASGLYDITVYDMDTGACTGASDGTCTDCFTVVDAPAISLSPNSGMQGASFAVTVTGTGTNWSSMHCVELSDGVSTFTFIGTAANASSLSGTINIPPGANPSSNYDVVVYSDVLGNCSGDLDGLCVDCFTVQGPLPVEWAYFTATRNDPFVDLHWATFSEDAVNYFEVQRSPNGSNWQVLGLIGAQGFSTTRTEYYFQDTTPYPGFNYYRIRQVDFDGHSSHTEIRSVEMPAKDFNVIIYPNPAQDKVNIDIQSLHNDPVEVSIFDVYGKLIDKVSSTPFETREINIEPLPSGVYIISCKQGDHFFSQQLIKTKM